MRLMDFHQVAIPAVLVALSGTACKSRQQQHDQPLHGPPGGQPVSCSALISAAEAGRSAKAVDGSPVRSATLRDRMRDMYECGMLAADDPKRCQLVEPSVRANCMALFRFWHAARRAGPDASWPEILADAMRDDCTNSFDGIPTADCDRMVQAIRSQKPDSCPASPPPLKQMCTAVASADPKVCRGNKDCEELAGRLALLKQGGGIARIAKQGTRRDRIHAQAALGTKDACKPESDAFRRACLQWGGKP